MKRLLLSGLVLLLAACAFGQYPSATQPDLWIDANAGLYSDAGTTICTNGTTCEQANDQSGHGRNATQATSGARPTFTTNVCNGKPGLLFNGTSTYLNSAYTGEVGTVFVVYAQDSAQSNSYADLLGADNNDSQAFGAYYVQASRGGATGVSFFSRSASDGTAVAAVTTPVVESFFNIFGASTNVAAKSVQGFWHGSAWGNAVSSTVAFGTIKTPTIGAGYYSHAVTDFFKGYICEVLIYSGNLSNAEFAQVNAYLENKWGLGKQAYIGSFFDEGGVGNNVAQLAMVSCPSPTGTWNWMPTFYVPTGGHHVRDPSIMWWPGASLYYLAHTNVQDYTVACSTFDVATSPDGIYWTVQKSVDCSSIGGGANQRTWAPEWFVDPADGSLHALFAGSATGNAFTGFQIYETHPTVSTNLAGAWSVPAALNVSGLPNNMIDPQMVVVGGTYYLIWSNATTHYIEIASASSLAGPFTSVESGNWAGWGSPLEGPCLGLVGSTWEIILDAEGSGMYTSSASSITGSYSGKAGVALAAMQTPSNFAHGTMILAPVKAARSGLSILGVGLVLKTREPWDWLRDLQVEMDDKRKLG